MKKAFQDSKNFLKTIYGQTRQRGGEFWQNLSVKNRRRVKIFVGVVLVAGSVRSLPYFAPIRAADLQQDEQAIEFRDRHGLPLGTLLTRDREHTAVAPLDEVSPYFLQGIIAAEDQRFYQHGALDLRAIARSLLEAVQAREIVSGASTITMQLARMLEPNDRTFTNKFKEIWLSWRIVAGMNHDQILHAYINRLPMGGNIYGVEAAARTYFGIPAADLNLAQASLLAAIPNDPTYLNPYYIWQPLKQRQKYVLDRMVADQYITQSQADRAFQEEISLQPANQGIIAAPHFLFWLANQVPNQTVQVKTTLNRSLQQFVETQVQQVVRSLNVHNAHHAAALVIDNHTGEVLAYVGSPDYFATADMGRNDGVQALRQPGSTLKPFLYELALEKKLIKPNTILADVPTNYAIPGAKLYSPTNYHDQTFLGPVRVRIALANSLNIPAVRVLEKVSVNAFLDRLHQLGFEHLTQSPEYYGLGLVLGSGEVSLWELARAYLTLARGGEFTPLITTLSPQQTEISAACQPETRANQSAKNLDCGNSNDQKIGQISPPENWALIRNMLSDRYARASAFGVESVLSLPFPAAVKTGTSSDFRDTWTVGFTTDYTVATWVGNFSGDRMKQVSGVVGAAPLWNRIMLHLHQNQEPANFSLPKNLVQRPICAITGLPPKADCDSVVLEYFYPEDVSEYDAIASQKNHQSVANLSPEYNEWLARQSQPNLPGEALKIVFPQNQDYFIMNSADSSRFAFKIAGNTTEPIEWWLNGEKISTQSDSSLFWTLKPGEWTLQVKSGKLTDQVSFQVVINDHPMRRGFSIADPK